MMEQWSVLLSHNFRFSDLIMWIKLQSVWSFTNVHVLQMSTLVSSRFYLPPKDMPVGGLATVTSPLNESDNV